MPAVLFQPELTVRRAAKQDKIGINTVTFQPVPYLGENAS